MPSVKEFLFGSPDKLKKVPTGTKEQQALHKDILSQAQNLAGGGYDQAQQYYNSLLQPGNEAFQNFAAPFMQNFQEQIIPGIMERFAGGGALSSSGFGQALGGAGAGLQSQLAQLFAQLQSQAAGAQTNQYNQLAQTGLNYQPFAYHQQQGSQGMMGPMMSGLTSAFAGPFAGMAMGGLQSLFKGGAGGPSPLTNTLDMGFRSGAIT
jgi:hypothetical protein